MLRRASALELELHLAAAVHHADAHITIVSNSAGVGRKFYY